jgi:hypothetical protein
MPKRKSAIHVEPKQPAPQVTSEQIEAMMRTPEFTAFATAWLNAVRAILAAQSQRTA